ncbi:class Ia ribonucleoside-diphosphate reductase subunit beta [Lacimicrobium sp. SS2-24]|uniref:class Ia ribonucleoside-diphosphate reductase subunit beta n=1 Tax=Lacimicrobium sp. SS2-24 TaxID=2005569 RepID=UPI000B4AAFF9|nr:class Ia ribonucleoside-diphosphate reductase subunit beta [Lacimicrobium sp. SS2-24]
MKYTTFNQQVSNPLTEPMFFGNPVNVARYDQQKHSIFEKLIEKQISFFWRPEEVDVSKDRVDFQKLTDPEKHIFISNLKYQTLLDSVQGRSPNIAFLPIVSLPELETWIETWSFFETIHSRSYTHILRNLFSDPSDVFEDIVLNEEIKLRASDISRYYDDLIFATQLWQTQGEGRHHVDGQDYLINQRELKKKLYLCMNSVNALEAIRFYVSFACTFAFAEREMMEGNSKIIRLIARDENLHLTSTQHILNLWAKGKDDPEMQEVAEECHDQARDIFIKAVEQEKKWASYLFQHGSMIGLNKDILCQYVEFIATHRMSAIGMESPFEVTTNPLPWMNNYLNSDNVQVAPQESEISSYLVGQIDSEVNADDFGDFDL